MATPKNLTVSQKQLQNMNEILVKYPSDYFLSGRCRRYLALDRWKSGDRYLRVHEDLDGGVMPGAVEHNRRELEKDDFGSFTRTARLINPLTSLNPVFGHASQMKVLSIGPRTEMEILHLIAVGFHPENISGLDLISASPFIDTGDMHKLPYGDRSFQVVISSWVLGYSSSPQLAVDEMVRVCGDGGLIAIGLTYEPGYGRGVVADNPADDEIVGSMYGSVGELKGLIGDKLDYVHFQQEPDSDTQSGPVMLIARIKHSG
jgi:SAM-dependent methyltransferase